MPVRRGPNADSVDATQVLSRDEILEAMEKVDKEEAAAYKAREEEAKLARQRQEEKEREEQEQQLARHRERREQARRAAAVAEAEDDGNGRRQWSEDLSDTKDEKPPLADMAAVVSADLAEKTRAAADGAPIEAKAEPKVDVKVVPARPQEKRPQPIRRFPRPTVFLRQRRFSAARI